MGTESLKTHYDLRRAILVKNCELCWAMVARYGDTGDDYSRNEWKEKAHKADAALAELEKIRRSALDLPRETEELAPQHMARSIDRLTEDLEEMIGEFRRRNHDMERSPKARQLAIVITTLETAYSRLVTFVTKGD